MRWQSVPRLTKNMRRPPNHDLRHAYRLHMLAALAASLAVVWGLLRFWPAPGASPPQAPIYSTDGQRIELTEITPTQQAGRQPPPPPAPLPPVVGPRERILEDLNVRFQDLALSTDQADRPEEASPPGNDTAQAPPQVDVGPRPVRFVEPEYTAAARKDGVRARVVVRVRVSAVGEVQEVEVTERYLLGSDASHRELVAHLGHGLEEAALSAARRWLFRPARQNGEAVASYTTLTFSFGVDS